MEKKKSKISWIRVLKNISYFMAPVLLLALTMSIVSIVYMQQIGGDREKESYFETTEFLEQYFYDISSSINKVIRANNELQIVQENKENQMSSNYYEGVEEIQLNNRDMQFIYPPSSSNFVYLIIDYKNDAIYTNESDRVYYYENIDRLKEEILSNKIYWAYENDNINTSIQSINEDAIRNKTFNNNDLQKDYEVYTAITNNLPYYDTYFTENLVHTITKNQYDYAIYNIPIVVILLIIMVPIIFIGIGKTGKSEEIYLNWFDKILIEFAIGLLIIVASIGCAICFEIANSIASIVSIMSISLGCIFLYLVCILLLETIVKRLKTHTFIKTTIAYFIYREMKIIFNNMKISTKIGVTFVGFGIANCIGFAVLDRNGFVGFIFLIGIYIASFVYILKKVIDLQKINKAIESIYKGNTESRLNESEFKGESKKVVEQINDIAGGFSNAIQEKLKSERLKTELITNVSHDIKTPLTSIINYVDLLKKEGITSENAEEYLVILDNKSQRLKKLTEDLVEASKASSGNIKMNMQELEVNELIKQVSAEFIDKFQTRGLEEIITFTKEPVYIMADNRYMYRVLENIYSNVSKYAMENSRVYIDIIEHGNNVIIQVKNVSKDKLNITVDELMQRFVRGDTSRNTEGSGLGLSIANSLTELQGGKFHIYLDGDLFKVTVGFQKSKN